MMPKKSRIPLTKRPTKSYPFPTPIPPCSVVSVRRLAKSPWVRRAGSVFRIGYYSPTDGLDCIWLVDEFGKYKETLDHVYLHRYFNIESVSKERSLYGRKRPPLGPLK
jgi:hypothetical protein